MIERSGDELVAELAGYGLHFLRGGHNVRSGPKHSPVDLIAALVGHGEARLRLALIPLFLSQPQLTNSVPAAAVQLSGSAQLTLQCFYTAACLLQQIYAEPFRRYGGEQPSLPDLFSKELGIPDSGTPEDRLKMLGVQHRLRRGQFVNWVGTYQSGAEVLLRQWRREALWQR
jgi:hypothetical protein